MVECVRMAFGNLLCCNTLLRSISVMPLVEEENEPGPESSLPTEIWEIIFGQLAVPHLLQVRSTCRYWKQIVDDSATLKDKIVVRIGGSGQKIVTRYTNSILSVFPTSSVRFQSTVLYLPLVRSRWWPPLAAGLSSLRLDNCVVSLQVLLAILKSTPNLKQLSMRGFAPKDAASVVDTKGLRLDHVERLELQNASIRNFNKTLTVLGRVFQRLKRFELSQVAEQKPKHENVTVTKQLVDGNEVVCVCIDLREVPELDEKEFCQRRAFGMMAKDFVLMHPTLEDLDLSMGILFIEEIGDVGNSLPNLKRLKINASETLLTVVPSFLAEMTNLEELELSACHGRLFTLEFRGMHHSNLRKLTLSKWEFQPEELQQFLHDSPGVHTLSLNECIVSTWLELFTSISQVEHVRHLHLSSVREVYYNDYFTNCIDNLQTLTMVDCRVSKRELKPLLRCCPNLEELALQGMDEEVDDETLLIVCQQMKCLRKLTIGGCSVTELAASHIIEHGHTLELLSVGMLGVRTPEEDEGNLNHGGAFSEEDIDRILAARNLIVSFVRGGKVIRRSRTREE